MSDHCYQKYTDLLKDAADLNNKRKGKGKKGKGKGPKRQAQQLKKQRFNKVLNDFGVSKDFVLAFVQHPSIWTREGIRNVVRVLRDV